MSMKRRGVNPVTGRYEPNDLLAMAANTRLVLNAPDAVLDGEVLTGVSRGRPFVATFDGHGFFIDWPSLRN